MRRALTKLLSEDHPSAEKRSCKQRDNNSRRNCRNARVSFSSAAFFFGSILAVGRAARRRSGGTFICHLVLRKRRNEVFQKTAQRRLSLASSGAPSHFAPGGELASNQRGVRG